MTIELDHLFVFCKVNAPEIERILDLGFAEGKSNIHGGQGTANRCIFWQNAMLELLWVSDGEEVSNPIVAPTNLEARSRYDETGFSPFGIGFTRTQANTNLPFTSWAYRPAYLTPPLQIDIASQTQPYEPLLFVIPFNDKIYNRSTNHANGTKKITGVEIIIPFTRPFSHAVDILEQQKLVRFVSGKEHLLTIEFDCRTQQQMFDFRPHLPLRFYW